MYGRKEIGMLLTNNNQHNNHECVKVPNEGNTQKEVPKFPILEGKSSQ